jgi:S-adenosylmethionine/arginine decarboxylase-like enzyme
MDRFKPIHQHLLIKAQIIAPITDKAIAEEFLSKLVKKIGMKAVTKPQATYVEDAGNEGFTGSINLATSHIAFHCWDESGLLMMDVYSCMPFSEETVYKHIADYMGVVEIMSASVNRADPLVYKKYIRNI